MAAPNYRNIPPHMLSKHEEFVTNVGQLQLVGFSRTMWKVKGSEREEKTEERNHQLSAEDSLIAFIISDNLSSQVPTANSTLLTNIYKTCGFGIQTKCSIKSTSKIDI